MIYEPGQALHEYLHQELVMVLLSILLILPLLITVQAKINPKGLMPIKGCNCAGETRHSPTI
jgi:hypothetical protein